MSEPIDEWEDEEQEGIVAGEVYNQDETRATDWHLFDAERGYQVREYGDGYQVMDENGSITDLSAEEFEQFRAEGPNPKDLP